MHGGTELQHRVSICSVHLQKILYLNAVLSLLFAAVMGTVAFTKAVAYHRYTPISAIILWFLFEPSRLYNGFTGNLTEKVSKIDLICQYSTYELERNIYLYSRISHKSDIFLNINFYRSQTWPHIS